MLELDYLSTLVVDKSVDRLATEFVSDRRVTVFAVLPLFYTAENIVKSIGYDRLRVSTQSCV